MNSQKTPNTSPESYGVSFMSTSTEIDRVIKGFYCIYIISNTSFVLDNKLKQHDDIIENKKIINQNLQELF